MSRSCHSATFSSAGMTAAAHQAGEAGQVLASAPDCACAASPTSPSALARNTPPPPAPRCAAGGGSRWRAARSSEATTPSAAKNAAWRSRGITWVETGSDAQAQLLRDMLFDARVDVGEGADRAGDRAGGDLLARRDQPRAGARELGVGQASLRPKVVGSAWMPWLRPMVGVSLCSKARRFERGEQRVDVGDQDVAGAAAAARRGRCRARRSWSCPDARSAPPGR